ncbi:MAG: DUF4277 domain-containing protein [Hormoscilla sp. GUM202]|nr:DUF4277 domain-containing protein [Hormoscilla sp. GUM202]
MEITNLDHLGLVAGIIDEIEIESIIDRLLPKHLSEKISSGQVVKAMIINAKRVSVSTIIPVCQIF